jgi:prepilin-type N-terminal cleavage/methylation domain-containing protein
MVDRSRGFTLLEMLVVILIMALVVTALSGGVHFAGHAWETQERQMDQEGDISAVQTAIRQMIVSGHGFDGNADSLRFVGQLPNALDRGGLFDMQLHAKANRLVLSWQPHFEGSAAPAVPVDSDLLENVSGIALSYLTGGAWQGEAKDKAKPPSLIKITIVRADGTQWLPLTVKPMIDVSPGDGK